MEDRTRKRESRIEGAVVLLLAALLGLSFLPGGATAAVEVGDPIPSIALQATGGSPYDLRAELIAGPILLAFVSPKCAPCRDSRPVLERISRAYRSASRLEIVSVMLGYGPPSSDPELAPSPPSSRLVQGDEVLAQAYGVFGTPMFFLAGRNGTVLWKHIGRLAHGSAERALADAIEAELAATALAR